VHDASHSTLKRKKPAALATGFFWDVVFVGSLQQQDSGEDGYCQDQQDPLTFPALQMAGVVKDDAKNRKHVKEGEQHCLSLFC
jgi:hypothetical protein